jgi:Meiotically up-regulated gene 113
MEEPGVRAQGVSELQDSGLEVEISSLYVARVVDTPVYKIGISTNLSQRLATISPFIPFSLKVVLTLRCFRYCGPTFEDSLLQHFQDRCVRGEWFRLTTNDLETIRKRYFPLFIRFMAENQNTRFIPTKRVSRRLFELGQVAGISIVKRRRPIAITQPRIGRLQF